MTLRESKLTCDECGRRISYEEAEINDNLCNTCADELDADELDDEVEETLDDDDDFGDWDGEDEDDNTEEDED